MNLSSLSRVNALYSQNKLKHLHKGDHYFCKEIPFVISIVSSNNKNATVSNNTIRLQDLCQNAHHLSGRMLRVQLTLLSISTHLQCRKQPADLHFSMSSVSFCKLPQTLCRPASPAWEPYWGQHHELWWVPLTASFSDVLTKTTEEKKNPPNANSINLS